MADEITTVVKVAGLDEVVNQLRNLGSQGERSFQQLQRASQVVSFTALTDAVSKLNSAFSGVTSSVQSFVQQIGSLVGVRISGFDNILDTLTGITKSATSAVGGIDKFARQMGASREEAAGFVSVMNQWGISTDDVQSAMRRLAIRVQNVWPEVVKTIRDAGDNAIKTQVNIEKSALGIVSAHLAVKQANTSLRQSYLELTKFVEDAAQRRRAADNSVRSAQIGLLEAQARLHELVTGEPLSEDEKKQLEISKAQLAVAQARDQLETARKAKARQAEEEAIQLELKQAAIVQARITLANAEKDVVIKNVEFREAQKKQIDEQANSVQRLGEFIKALSKGEDTSKFNDLNKTAANLIKGMAAAMPGADAALLAFEGGIHDITSEMPKMIDFLTLAGDVFKNLGDGAVKEAVKVQLFGRTVPDSLIKLASQGKAAIQAQIEENERLGLSFTKTEIDASKAFKIASGKLDAAQKTIGDKIGVQFAPIGTMIMDAITGRLREATPQITEFFNELVKQIEPFFKALSNVIRGIKLEDFISLSKGLGIDDKTIDSVGEWQLKIERAFTIVKSIGQELLNMFKALSNVLSGKDATEEKFKFGVPTEDRESVFKYQTAIEGVLKKLDQWATLINKVAGTNLSGTELGFLGILGHITGINKAITDVGFNILALGVAIKLIFGTGGLIAIAIAGLGAYLVSQFTDSIGLIVGGAALAGLIAFFVPGGALAIAVLAAAQFMSNTFGSGNIWTDFKNGFFLILDDMKNGFQLFVQDIQNFFKPLFDWLEEKVSSIFKKLAPSPENARIPSSGGDSGVDIGDVLGRASGGLILGPGTSTSDSILARLSHGEWVHPARAVRYYGQSFMRAVNNLQLPRGFAVGGLVTAPGPAFASAGVGTPSPAQLRALSITIGGSTFAGFSGPADTVNRLEKRARMEELTSTGRSPNRVR